MSQDTVPDLHRNPTEVAPQRVRGTGFGRNGCALELTWKLCVLCVTVFVYSGENCITFFKAQVNFAAATVTDYRVKRNSVARFLASAAMQMTFAHSRDNTRRRMAVYLPTVRDRILTTIFQGSSMSRGISSWNSWRLSTGPIARPEKSVRNLPFYAV